MPGVKGGGGTRNFFKSCSVAFRVSEIIYKKRKAARIINRDRFILLNTLFV